MRDCHNLFYRDGACPVSLGSRRRGKPRLYRNQMPLLAAGHRHFRAAQFLLSRIIAGHRELENGTMVGTMVGTMAGPRLDPYLPAIVLDDLLTDCQTDSVARVFGPGVQALEDNKNIFCVLRRNPDPVIAHAEQPLLARFLGFYGN